MAVVQELLTEAEKPVFNTGIIGPGDLIVVFSTLWSAPKTGVAVRVTERCITYLHHPGIANVGIQLKLFAEDVTSGDYAVRWSSDLVTFSSYPPR